MSLLKTLAKVAIGIAVTKGVGSILKKGGSSGSTSSRGGGLGDILEQLGGAQRGGQSGTGGSLGDLIGGMAGQGRRASDNSLGDIFGDFLGDAPTSTNSNESFGDLFNQSLEKEDEPEAPPSAQQEAVAALMLRAMIQAMKSDGKIDGAEEEKLMEHLGDISLQERQFVNQELANPVDIKDLARQTPRGLEPQVYLMSLMAIDLDKQAEAQYLHDLATAMGLEREEVNAIHDHIDVPHLYS